MNGSWSYRIVACLMILTMASLNVFAEQPAKTGSAGERAFLRGGSAISDALAERTAPKESIVPPKLPVEQPPAALPAPQTEGKHRKTMLWIGIAVTGTIAVYLIQRSVRNHGHIFGSGSGV